MRFAYAIHSCMSIPISRKRLATQENDHPGISRRRRLQNAWKMHKNHKHGPEQVHNIMAPFGPIFAQDGSHGLWEASGMPPGPKNAKTQQKFWFSRPMGRYWPLLAVANTFNNPMRWLIALLHMPFAHTSQIAEQFDSNIRSCGAFSPLNRIP